MFHSVNMNGNATPLCSVCCDTLGKYGGPVTLPCGHNGCLQCMAIVRRSKSECPLCRQNIPDTTELVINRELRDLVSLASALHTVDQDGWEAVTSNKILTKSCKLGADADDSDVTLVPTAPPVHVSLSTVLQGGGDLLSLEPPTWLPDSHAQECGNCQQTFRALRRSRHHCRLCGGIFCASCSSKALLLPPKFQQQQPQRLCDPCADLLEPLQPFLAGTIAQAVRPAIHDVTDGSVMRSWLNSPLSSGLESDIYKATNILNSFAQVGYLQPEKGIPAAVLQGAAGFAILSVAKVGLGWSAAMGSGLVVVRGDRGDWSPPSALAMASVGWGLQAGGALHDLLIVLRDRAAVQAFCGSIHCGVGGNVSLAMGPVGRQADANMRLGRSGAAVCYSYSCSRGAYAGVSVEGTIITTRDHANQGFYGRALTGKQLLLGGAVSQPTAAKALYAALHDLMDRVEEPVSVAASTRVPRMAGQASIAHGADADAEESEEERPGRGRATTRSPVIAPSLPSNSEESHPTVRSSQVMGATQVSDSESEDEDDEEEEEDEENLMGDIFAE